MLMLSFTHRTAPFCSDHVLCMQAGYMHLDFTTIMASNTIKTSGCLHLQSNEMAQNYVSGLPCGFAKPLQLYLLAFSTTTAEQGN